MSRVALITGGTDGIGKAIAIAFAKRDFTVHILGRSKAKGDKVIDKLNTYSKAKTHRLFLVDLSKMAEVNQFLEHYVQQFKQLDVLVLNAGVHPNKHMLSDDGIDITFSIGYVSRYLFSVKLNHLLSQNRGKVIHINGSVMGKIHFDELNKPKYSKMTSVWQNSIGSALLVVNWHTSMTSLVDHIHWNPGIVNTQTVKSQNVVIRYLSKMMGMVEAEEAGRLLVECIIPHLETNLGGRFYFKGKEKRKKSKIALDAELFKTLINFSESFTKVAFI